MEYFDTNIYVYAFCQNIDNQEQKKLSQKLLKTRASNDKLLVAPLFRPKIGVFVKRFGCTKLRCKCKV